MPQCNLPHRARTNLVVYESFLKQKNIAKAATFARNVCPIPCDGLHLYLKPPAPSQCDPDPKDDLGTVKFSAVYLAFRDSPAYRSCSSLLGTWLPYVTVPTPPQ